MKYLLAWEANDPHDERTHSFFEVFESIKHVEEKVAEILLEDPDGEIKHCVEYKENITFQPEEKYIKYKAKFTKYTKPHL